MLSDDLPFVSVIVPVRDDPRLSACLAALARQTYPANRFEILIADNGSREPVRAPAGARVIHVPTPGSYSARNAAVEQSRGTILAFTDSDCLPAGDWIEECVAGIEAGAGIVAGAVQVYARDPRKPSSIEAYELVHAFPQKRYAERGGACVTANMTTTKFAFVSVGGFRAELLSGADIEWSQRANAAGYLTVFRASALVRHPARQSFAAMSAKLRRVMAGRYERDALDGRPEPHRWPGPRSVRPPIGAFRRAAAAPELTTLRARASFVVGEFYHRYASAWIAAQLAWRERRSRSRN